MALSVILSLAGSTLKLNDSLFMGNKIGTLPFDLVNAVNTRGNSI